MFDTDDIPSNPTHNPHLADMIGTRLSRRGLIGGALAATVMSFVAAGSIGSSSASASDDTSDDTSDDDTQVGSDRGTRSLLGFASIEASKDDTIRVPDGYTWDVMIPWGTPLFAGVAWKEDASNTAAEQALQVGFNHDGMHYFPFSNGNGGNHSGLLVLNHEYTDASQIYSAAQGSAITPDGAGREKVAKALAGHGVTVVEVAQLSDGTWTHVGG